jgi:uncharacterized membrane protein
MKKIRKIFEYGYLLIAIFFIFETINNFNDGNNERAWLLLVFSVLAVFMYFFRKYFRRKNEDRFK